MLRTTLSSTLGGCVLCRLFVRYYHTEQARYCHCQHTTIKRTYFFEIPLTRDCAAEFHHVFLHKRNFAAQKTWTNQFSKQWSFSAHQAICSVGIRTGYHWHYHCYRIFSIKMHRHIRLFLLVVATATLWIGQKCNRHIVALLVIFWLIMLLLNS